jgi:Fe2+ transport system protein FeoA
VNVLTDLRIGETATLVSLELPDSVQNYLMHMGFVPDALVTALRRAPAGDPTVYGIDGMEIALRRETAEAIRIRHTSDTSRGESDAELEELAAELQPDRKAEIHEFAGAAR